jgi:hypothetical protein
MGRFVTFCFAIFLASPALGQEWGNLTALFVYDGQPPKPKELLVDKDINVCGRKLLDESLVVNDQNRGIANVVMWLAQPEDKPPAPVHADYEEGSKAELTLSAKECRFDPHVLLVRSTQALAIRNEDPIGHTFRAALSLNNSFDHTAAGGRGIVARFTTGEDAPAQLVCNIHPWMQGWLFVHDSPYMAVSDASGKLTIPKVPVGKWSFLVWHERKGLIRSFSHDGKPTELPRQGWSLEIKPGKNDLGDVLLKSAQLERN